jgi:hypothetical protein
MASGRKVDTQKSPVTRRDPASGFDPDAEIVRRRSLIAPIIARALAIIVASSASPSGKNPLRRTFRYLRAKLADTTRHCVNSSASGTRNLRARMA